MNDYLKILQSISFGGVRQYKGSSHQTKDDIKQQQAKHAKSIIQPLNRDGTVNKEYVKEYGEPIIK